MIYKCTTKERTSTNFIVVHCSATQAKADIGAAEIDRWHRQRGWQCIGYHYVIRRDGTVENGRDDRVVGAHVEGHNSDSIGICMAGGIDKDGKSENNFTEDQFTALRKLCHELKRKYPAATVQGHRDFPGVKKDCPCFPVKDWAKLNDLA